MSKGKFKKAFKENRNLRGEEASKIRRIAAVILLLLTIFIVAGAISGYFYLSSALEPVDPESEETVDIEIPIGSTTSSIASILEENNIINNALIFRLYINFRNESGFQAGDYSFSPSMSIDDIIESLKSGRVIQEAVHRVTVPEGLTIEQIAAIFSEHFSFTEEEFIEKANDEEYIHTLIDKYSLLLSEEILHEDIRTPLEGYLFGITYDFYEEEPEVETVIEMMLDQTHSIISTYLEELDEHGFTIHEALTFASIIERETGTIDQRDEISGVFHNRLEEGMQLQTDPTVIYALGEHRDRVLYEDLEVESPYNTYYIEGLPIGPISNFAQSSLEAVLNPEEHTYLYFVHDQDGEIYFAETLEEHNQNINNYRD